MNENVIKQISEELNIPLKYVKVVLDLLTSGNTIPFIARYRKEQTNAMDEEAIKKISEVYEYEVNLLKRKEDVIRLIDEKGLLTEELKNNIMACKKLVEVEDLYRPYKEKKKTKATDAINNGLEPLAKMIMSFKLKDENIISKYLNDKVKTVSDAKIQSGYIISEWISDNAYFRKWIRNYIYRHGFITTKVKKDNNDTSKLYEMYYDYKEEVSKIKPHRILAINRAEEEKVVSVKIEVDYTDISKYLISKIIKDDKNIFCNLIIDSIDDSYKRLIFPSIEREIRSELKEKADTSAIENFSKNLENLLLTPPIKEKVVLAFDPGYVNGCKLAVVDKTGKYLDSTVIKPFLNNISLENLNKCKLEVLNLINKYKVDIISIGNGTASRESEKFVSDLIKENNLSCKYVIVSEAGASIYSASDVAIKEFPDLAVEKRSAVSIARRLQDPLSELVKIPPEGIGVGLYQHDVSQKNLKESLDFVVSKAVNSVGVNINTASASILKYISGITKTHISKLIEKRDLKGAFKSREELKSILTGKSYEQAIGFLRIQNKDNILDSTSIHPESYDVALKLLNKLNLDLSLVGSEVIKEKLDGVDINLLSEELNTDRYTLSDIIKSLISPQLDPRDNYPQPILKSDVLNISDLSVGMALEGTVRNVVDFGAFVDIGLHNDGLIHISKMTDKYIKHPSEILKVGDIIKCYVIDINKEKEKVSLSLKEV